MILKIMKILLLSIGVFFFTGCAVANLSVLDKMAISEQAWLNDSLYWWIGGLHSIVCSIVGEFQVLLVDSFDAGCELWHVRFWNHACLV